MRYLIARYHEIALKRGNRWRFTAQLRQNLKSAFADCPLGAMRGEGPRLLVELPDSVDDATARERAALVFGIENFSIAHETALDIEAVRRKALEVARQYPARSFRVESRRTDKRFPLTSMEINRIVGADIKGELGLAVDLEKAELTITVELLRDAAFVAAGRHRGAGGLPVGVSGRAMALLSGGIDSPVAAFRMMKRGLRLDFVHFHSYPLVSSASRDKAEDLAASLTRYQSHSALVLVPFAPVQREIVARAPRPLRVILYRRFMIRIAEALARRSGAKALVTGESLGQVASQTLDNITVIDRAASLPILRPLVGMDKNEIVEQARRLGTFETSILPDQDCCSLFVPAHPETHAEQAEVEAAEAAFDVGAMVAQAVAASESVTRFFPAASGQL